MGGESVIEGFPVDVLRVGWKMPGDWRRKVIVRQIGHAAAPANADLLLSERKCLELTQVNVADR
jgi:hypothetical protein